MSDIFVCFNMFNVTDYILAPPGQVGCDCAEVEVNETTSNAWGWDNRLGRDCEKVAGRDFFNEHPLGCPRKLGSMIFLMAYFTYL